MEPVAPLPFSPLSFLPKMDEASQLAAQRRAASFKASMSGDPKHILSLMGRQDHGWSSTPADGNCALTAILQTLRMAVGADLGSATAMALRDRHALRKGVARLFRFFFAPGLVWWKDTWEFKRGVEEEKVAFDKFLEHLEAGAAGERGRQGRGGGRGEGEAGQGI